MTKTMFAIAFMLVVLSLGLRSSTTLILADETTTGGSGEKQAKKGSDPTNDLLEQKRREVRMLDDIYKGGIVVITDKYVTDEDAIPAGTAFKQLFIAAEKKGWHQVRLLDATGDPYNDENSPRDDFEKQAVKELVAGKPQVEQIEVRDGVKHLRVATPIPVVFQKCTMCHDHYADVPKGQAIGALSYVLPIDGPLVSKPPQR